MTIAEGQESEIKLLKEALWNISYLSRHNKLPVMQKIYRITEQALGEKAYGSSLLKIKEDKA